VDAVRVAKVKNMYGQDLQNGMAGKFDIELSPSFAILPSAEGSIQTAN